MDDLNNYVVIGVRHYNDLLNELFTLRQNNVYLNQENAELLKEQNQTEPVTSSVFDDLEDKTDEDTTD